MYSDHDPPSLTPINENAIEIDYNDVYLKNYFKMLYEIGVLLVQTIGIMQFNLISVLLLIFLILSNLFTIIIMIHVVSSNEIKRIYTVLTIILNY